MNPSQTKYSSPRLAMNAKRFTECGPTVFSLSGKGRTESQFTLRDLQQVEPSQGGAAVVTTDGDPDDPVTNHTTRTSGVELTCCFVEGKAGLLLALDWVTSNYDRPRKLYYNHLERHTRQATGQAPLHPSRTQGQARQRSR